MDMRVAADASGSEDQPWTLPEGWCWAPLKAITSFIGRGRGPSYVEKNGVPVVNQKCVRWHRLDVQHLRLTARDAFDRLSPELRLRRGDLLWNSTGTGTIGRAAVYDGSFEELTADSHVTIVRPVEVEPRYLGYFVETGRVQHLVGEGHVGSTNQRELPRAFVEELLLPIAPLAEQRHIVERIDTLFAEIADGEAALDEARKGLETFRRALLKSAVTGELTRDWRETNQPNETGRDLLARIKAKRGATSVKGGSKRAAASPPLDTSDLPELPEGWAWERLSALGEFGRGKSKHRPRDDARLYGGNIPFIQTGIVANAVDYIKTYSQTYSEFGVSQSKIWPAGTLCITIAANIAKTSITTFDCCFPDSIVGLVPSDGIDAYWIHVWLQTIQQRLEQYAPATAQKNINLEVLNSVAVPIPPPAEMAEALVRIKAALTAYEDVKLSIASGFADAARLRQAILKSAFEGTLVPQDPADEPAFTLLSRLKAQEGANPKQIKRRKKV